MALPSAGGPPFVFTVAVGWASRSKSPQKVWPFLCVYMCVPLRMSVFVHISHHLSHSRNSLCPNCHPGHRGDPIRRTDAAVFLIIQSPLLCAGAHAETLLSLCYVTPMLSPLHCKPVGQHTYTYFSFKLFYSLLNFSLHFPLFFLVAITYDAQMS